MDSRCLSCTSRTERTGSLATNRNSPCAATTRGSEGDRTCTPWEANSVTASPIAVIWRWKLPDTVTANRLDGMRNEVYFTTDLKLITASRVGEMCAVRTKLADRRSLSRHRPGGLI